MKAMYKKRWLAALRSGEYAKGKGCLVSEQTDNDAVGSKDDQFCCLGVLCDVMGTEFESIEPFTAASAFFGPYIGRIAMTPVSSKSDTFLPSDLREKVGLDEEQEGRLADINDSSGTFNRVISYIETEL